MIKIKDRILLGMVSGLAGIPGMVLNTIESRKGLTDSRYNRVAISLFTKKNKTKSIQAKTLATIAIFINGGVVGIVTTYLLSFTGRDYAVIKGMGLGAFTWITINGFIGNIITKRKSKSPVPPILNLVDHIINGGLCAVIVSKLGDDSLFPDTKSLRRGEKLPTISMNNEKNYPSLEHSQNDLQ